MDPSAQPSKVQHSLPMRLACEVTVKFELAVGGWAFQRGSFGCPHEVRKVAILCGSSRGARLRGHTVISAGGECYRCARGL
eukprot:3396883-Pyramimonas_sp.AAC.1